MTRSPSRPPESTDTDFVTDDPPHAFRTAHNVLAEIAKLQSDAEYTKRDLSELRTDMRDLRDRMARLEERVHHLPSKEFIVIVVTTALVIIGGLMTVAPKLWSLTGASPTIATTTTQAR